jgi:hypothetical protein
MTDSFIAALQKGKERPRARRAPIVVRVECKTPRIFAQGSAENISETGMLIGCRETFEISQTVTLRFTLPVAQKTVVISTGAVVARMERGRFMGVQFLGLRQAFRDAIGQYIESTGSVVTPPSGEAHPKKR